MASKPASNHDKGCWWHSLNEECPITLELLSTLPYPPFHLPSGGITSYFDGLALASYVVSRGIFQNPLTREDLSMADCRRLDQYLETNCYKNLQQYPLSTTRKVSVVEAFALRNAVHVDQRGDNQSRARMLQSTATAALAGLFVYGNHRPRRGRWHSEEENENGIASTPNSSLHREDQLILDWGFDLSRTVDDSVAGWSQEGWTVIDDDEAMVVATQREAYNATQTAFPPLHQSSAPSEEQLTSVGPNVDEQIVNRVRELSIQEAERERKEAQRLELARRRLLAEALDRREERRKIRRKKLAEGNAQWEKKQQEDEETQRARAEIERWREEQWQKLREISESQQKMLSESHKSPMTLSIDEKPDDDDDEVVPNDMKDQSVLSTEEIEARKKAKAAAKRKRAKEKKKLQKEEERKEQEKVAKQKELEAQKAASLSKCSACGEGILDCGFEKFGRPFCSPKCARSAQTIK